MLEQLLSVNLPRALPSDLTLLIILLLIRNSSNKLYVILNLKRLYLFWIPYWLVHGIFYFYFWVPVLKQFRYFHFMSGVNDC